MKNLIILLSCLLFAGSVYGWGQKGHDVTAYIAECHLTPEAAQKIDKVLNGHSPVYYCNWMDIASHTPEYNYTKTWHYLNIDEGQTLETMPRNPKGDVLTAVTALAAALGVDVSAPEFLNAKEDIGVVLDEGCFPETLTAPQVGRARNQRPVLMFGRKTNLHSAWDSAILEAGHKWSYTEWQEQIDRLTDDEAALVQAGEPQDWLKETHAICVGIYEDSPEGTKISYDYVDKYTPVIEQQFVRGGYRPARPVIPATRTGAPMSSASAAP